jgi:hypothetical protein
MQRDTSLFNHHWNSLHVLHIHSSLLQQCRFFLHGRAFHCDCRIFRSLNTL